jgi:hypothetical protein
MKKLAIIRNNAECPFGLPIPFGCKNIGEKIDYLRPTQLARTDEELKEIIELNNQIMMTEVGSGTCPFAQHVLEKSVECNFQSNGIDPKGLVGSNFYTKLPQGPSFDGMFSFPQGPYGDEGNSGRNSYYSYFSSQGSSMLKYKKASIESDIKDAIQHAAYSGINYNGKVCFKVAYEGDMQLDEILKWDDISSWGEWKREELKDLNENDFNNEIESFRGKDWLNMAKEWINGTFPPIILISTAEGDFIGDGRGRVSLAYGLDLDFLPVIVLNEDEMGNICYNFSNGDIINQ